MSNLLKYINKAGLNDLSNKLDLNIKSGRYNGDGFKDYWSAEEEKKYIHKHPKNIDISGLKNLKFSKIPKETKQYDLSNSRLIYDEMKKLSPLEACHKGTWIWLTHFFPTGYLYTINRWNTDKLEHSTSEEMNAKAKQIDRHFFTGNNGPRNFKRDNSLSRLFWISKIADRVGGKYDYDERLKIIHTNPEVRSNIADRAEISNNVSLLDPFLHQISRHSKERLIKKEFRDFCKIYNRVNSAIFKELDKKTIEKFASANAKKIFIKSK